MTLVLVILAVLLGVGIALGLYATLVPRRSSNAVQGPARSAPARTATTDWTKDAGEEFGGLSEAARCDLIFAVNDLRDERSQVMLEHALDDPSDAVALAAAHALSARGKRECVESYAQRHPGERAQRILDTLALLG